MPVDVLIRPFLKELNRLGDFPLTDSEMQQIIAKAGDVDKVVFLLTEQQLDSNIKAFVTLYLNVTGPCLNELKASL